MRGGESQDEREQHLDQRERERERERSEREHGKKRVDSTNKEGRFQGGKEGQGKRASLRQVEGSTSG